MSPLRLQADSEDTVSTSSLLSATVIEAPNTFVTDLKDQCVGLGGVITYCKSNDVRENLLVLSQWDAITWESST